VLDAFEQIYNKEGGLSAFYVGILQDTGKSIADSFLFFLFYNYLRTNRLQKNSSKSTTLSALDELGVGALAGACSKFFTTPISNIVTRKQTASLLSSRSSTSSPEPTVSDITSTIRKEKGLQGFWSGYSASLVLTLNPSLTFFLYEFFKRSFLPHSQRDNPGAKLTFLMAAMSKAIASTTTYPFSLAKARAQTSSSPPVDPSSAEKVKDEVKHIHTTSEAQKAEKDAKVIAKKSAVFHTILKIYKEEGASALYEGVWGEILKGFFSHGITMLLKESIHKLIIQSYYLILKALNKYPSPTELANQAGVAIQDGAERAGELVKEGYENASETISSAVESVGDAAEKTGAGAMLKEGYENATGRVTAAVESGKDAVGIAVKRAGVKGDNATKVVEAANDYASKDAGHLLGNAQDMLGGKIEEGGKGIKSEK
jgi:hypothetical protein